MFATLNAEHRKPAAVHSFNLESANGAVRTSLEGVMATDPQGSEFRSSSQNGTALPCCERYNVLTVCHRYAILASGDRARRCTQQVPDQAGGKGCGVACSYSSPSFAILDINAPRL